MKELNKFDNNNKSLIGSFLALQDDCYHQENFFLGEAFYNTNKNKIGFIRYQSFYSLFRDICDIPIFFLINEEVSNAHGRDCFPLLLTEIITEKHYITRRKHRIRNVELDVNHTYSELSELLINKFNQSLGSQMLDFYVAAYSSFENWITKLHLKFCPNHHDELKTNRKERIKNLLKTYHEEPTDECLQRTVDKLFEIRGDFISLPDKINKIFKLIDKSLYSRSIDEDKNILLFLGKIRNTVHNSGFHHGKTACITFNNCTHTIEHGKPYSSPSWTESLKLIGELVNIYTEILKSIPNRSGIIESFIEPACDMLSIEIFKETANDLIAADDPKIQNTFQIFLINKMKIGEVVAKNIVNLLTAKKQPFNDIHEVLVFLAQDFTQVN